MRSGDIDLMQYAIADSSVYGKEFDQTLPIFYVCFERFWNLHCFQSQSRFVVARKINALNGAFGFFKVYDPFSWLLIFGSLVVFLIAFFLTYQFASKFMHKEQTNFNAVSCFELVRCFEFNLPDYKCKWHFKLQTMF